MQQRMLPGTGQSTQDRCRKSEVINVDIDVDDQRRGNQRVTSAVTFQLVKTIAGQELMEKAVPLIRSLLQTIYNLQQFAH